MKPVRIKITKHGRGRYLINRASVKKLRAAAHREGNLVNDFKITIGKNTFSALEQKDGRIEIPKSIVRKYHLRAGYKRVGERMLRKGDSRVYNKRYTTAGRTSRIFEDFWEMPIENVNEGEVAYKIIRRIEKNMKGYIGFYVHLHFILHCETAPFYRENSFTLPVTSVSDIPTAEMLIRMINTFVKESFYTERLVMQRPYVFGILFVGSAVILQNLTSVPVRDWM